MATESRPKVFEGARDIILSLGVTVIAMLLVVGATGLCSVNPEKSGPVQTVDAATFLEMEARAEGAVIREPQMPEGWTATAARRVQVGPQSASVVSWLTPGDGYVESAQTAATLEEATKNYDANYREEHTHRVIDGQEFSIYASEDKDVRPLWVAYLGDARLILTGAAPDADFEAALKAFVAAAPLQIDAEGNVVEGK
ncbi:DUF4245 domain-containing protein [Corynebacterium sp.]|uniref:DUF4245 domain-containing protein n=1 Tax=Corynebacterium sp. TaxID=1720 RepID=UPI0026DD5DBC|nr:DUF4245 domain-containing protein [Corynebacterium sp.]MDO5032804.1 DUF4245 domain-containing protein [Corynebacterium sp.]